MDTLRKLACRVRKLHPLGQCPYPAFDQANLDDCLAVGDRLQDAISGLWRSAKPCPESYRRTRTTTDCKSILTYLPSSDTTLVTRFDAEPANSSFAFRQGRPTM